LKLKFHTLSCLQHTVASEAALDNLPILFDPASADVICEALTKWCHRTGSEPDAVLMSKAIALYSRGKNTPEKLIEALQKELLN
jgi:hypothetical protein